MTRNQCGILKLQFSELLFILQRTTKPGESCINHSNSSETSVSQFMYTHLGSSHAQLQCAHTGHLPRCTHALLETYFSEHRTQNMSPSSSDEKSTDLQPYRQVITTFSSPVLAVLCTAFFLKLPFLLTCF
jgi:hypothetical protein